MRTLILVISTVLVLTACGPRWMYTNLDWLVPWYVDDYIALDPQQNDELAMRLAHQLDWHCRTQMPRYAVFLRQVRDELSIPGQPVRAARWADHLDQLKQFWIELVRRLAPDALAILVAARDEQIDALFANLEKTNRELAQEYVAPPVAERRRNRQQRMQKRLVYWTGPLSKAQQQIVAEWARGVDETAEDWLAHRRRFQDTLHQQLRQRHRGNKFQRGFIGLLVSPEKLRDPAYDAKIEANKIRTFQLLEKLSQTLTLAQRRHIVNRFAELAEEMEQLACEPARVDLESGS
jgi:hypothetical protein